MKNRLIKILSCAAILVAISCNKQLDTTPTQSIDDKDALKTNSDVQAALVGSYHDLGDYDFYGGNIFVMSELLGDNNELDWSGTYQGMTQVKNKLIPVDNVFIRDTWLAGYVAINDVNNVLNALSVVDEDKKARVEGEARFIRGSSYFDLVRIFAKAWNDGDPNTNPGIPIVLMPTTIITDANKVARSSVADVYTQVINDLTNAAALLPESNGFFATRIAATAMLARVYLQKQDYTNAAAYADTAIKLSKRNGLALKEDYADAFPNPDPDNPTAGPNTSEDIFAMQVTSSSGVNEFQEFFSENGRGDIIIAGAHFDLYESGDERLNLFSDDYTTKFDNLYGNVHIIRLAEMYLIRAEANFRLGTAVGADPVDDVNEIRRRANVDKYKAGDLTLDNIILERRRELAFEGFRLYDEKRLEQNVGILPWNSPKLIFPIPVRDIRVNPNLTQNEGY